MNERASVWEAYLPAERILTAAADRLVYDADAVTLERVRPTAVLLVRSAAEISAAVRHCNEHGIAFITRGAGTGLSGGAIACGESVMIVTSSMNRIVEVNVGERYAIVECGVVNAALSR